MSGYKIYTLQKLNATNEGVVIKSSKKKNKKVDVFDKKGKLLASIGGVYPNGKFYKDYATYVDLFGLTEAKKKMKAYIARHKKEPKEKIINGKKVKTPSYWADVILWEQP
tara:strand:+ start:5730 stop:6059 length:330 start_codon:yes stop_codon:yes gene_type:complete